jgi:hypothetical protein
MATREWRVVVEGIGDIGSVVEDSEELARCAALSKYSEDGDRASKRQAIFEDDEFSVFLA